MHHTVIDTVGGTVTGRVHDRGDEVDIGTVITKKVIVRGEKFSESVPRSVRCNVATELQEAIIRGSVMELWPVRRWRTVRGLRCL